jgi:hypothetical protein
MGFGRLKINFISKIHGTYFFHIKFVDRPNIKCRNGHCQTRAQVFLF